MAGLLRALDVDVHPTGLAVEASDGWDDGRDALLRARGWAADLAVDRQLRRLRAEWRRRRDVEDEAAAAEFGRKRRPEEHAATVRLEGDEPVHRPRAAECRPVGAGEGVLTA